MTHDVDEAEPMNRSFQHAVVFGGSIAGLLAARVLSDTFERVTLIERDDLASAPEPRKGIPQGRHVHNLLLRGQIELAALFPGLVDELLAAGATTIEIGKALAWHHGGAWRRMRESNAASPIAMSRPLLESVVANRIRAIPNLTVLERTRVLAPRQDGAGGVVGLDIATVGHDDARAIDCDFVVDASGRGSAMPQWLTSLGFDAPTLETLVAPITYSSCVYRRNEAPRDWKQLFVTGAPAKRNGCIAPMEGDRWLVSVAALFDEPAPTDHASLLDFARSLPTPEFHDTLKASEPLTEVVRVRFPGSQRRRYDRLARFPAGLIVIGDAVCSFNPLFGQGMTVSAVEAGILGRLLAREKASADAVRPDFARRWFRAIRPAVSAAWNTVMVEDYRYAELATERPAALAPLQWYLGRVHRATHRDPEVTDTLVKVISFVASPLALLAPRMLAKVLWPYRSAGVR